MDKKKILNPLTGRMIDANGATAKSIKEKQKKVSVLEAVVKRKLTKKPEPPKPEPKPKRTYITKKKKEEASKVLQGAVKRTLAKKPEPKKEEASKVLQAMVKRKLAKKPEPPKPAPKKYGWEDLDEGVKDMISAYVKKNKKIDYDAIRKYILNVRNYYNIYSYNLSEEEISSMKNKELYDLAYGGKLDRLIDYSVITDFFVKRDWNNKLGFNLRKRSNGDIYFRHNNILAYLDYGDNLKLYNYLINHPVNDFEVLAGTNMMIAPFYLFKGDDVNTNGSNVEEYEYLTAMESSYSKEYKDEYGISLKPYSSLSLSIPKKIFHIKVPQSPYYKDLKNWKEAERDMIQFGFRYNQDKTILEYKDNGFLKPAKGRGLLAPTFEKP